MFTRLTSQKLTNEQRKKLDLTVLTSRSRMLQSKPVKGGQD